MRRGYTLVEILISVSLSLFLLLGVTQLFRSVGTSVVDAQATLIMSRELNWAAMTLRNDLEGLTMGPFIKDRFTNPTTGFAGGDNGYFQIIEGMGAPYGGDTTQNAWNTVEDIADFTVGDVDDILMFTVQCSGTTPFRGLVGGNIEESIQAEIIWFMRGNTLYRRVLLIDENGASPLPPRPNFYRNNDISVRWDNTSARLLRNSLSDLAKRENRYGHWSLDSSDFPFPTHDNASNSAWYYLRMPTLDECAHSDWTAGGPLQPVPNLIPQARWDFWDVPNVLPGLTPKTGSISSRSDRIGEDIVLTNVISFDVKVWNPYWVPCHPAAGTPGPNVSNAPWLWAPPQYVDLGQDSFVLENLSGQMVPCLVNYQQMANPPSPIPTADWGIGFCSKGRYSGVNCGAGSLLAESIYFGDNNLIWSVTPGTFSVPSIMPCVYDTWSTAYETAPSETFRTVLTSGPGTPILNRPNGVGVLPSTNDYFHNGGGAGPVIKANLDNWECPPPYSTPLKGIEITIRCFDPRSKNIKQIRIVKDF